MIIFLHGTDTHRSRRKLNEIIANFRAREDKAGMNTTTLDATKVEIGDISQALFSPAFLGNKRLTVIVGLLALKKDEQKPYLDLIERLPDSTTAVFFESAELKVLEKSPFYPLLSVSKFNWEFAPMNASQMGGWLLVEASAKGVQVESNAVSALVEAVAGDSARAENELAKLISYVGEKKKITLADVLLLVQAGVHEDMFGFLDAVAGARVQVAAKMLEEQIASGTEPMQILAMLGRTVRLLIQAKDMLERGLPQNEAVKELGIHPFAARKSLDQARNFEMNFLRGLHSALLDADRKVKTGQTPTPRLVLDLFIAKAISK